jgi:nitrous oxidase accessory protein
MWKYLLLAAFLLMVSSQAATITVAPGGADFSSIQAAADAANFGDLINITPGVYSKNLIINKTIALRGIGAPVIENGGQHANGPAIILLADGILLEGLVLVNSGSTAGEPSGTGIEVQSSHNTIAANIIKGAFRSGIELFNSSNNTIARNQGNSSLTGLSLRHSSFNSIMSNNFSHNKGDGISLNYSKNNTVERNEVSYNKGRGFVLDSADNNSLLFNTASYNRAGGLYLHNSNNNQIYQNNFINNTGYNVFDDGINRWGDSWMGNYYSDINCTDSNDDGICDSPYRIPGGTNTDKFPSPRLIMLMFYEVAEDIFSSWESYLSEPQPKNNETKEATELI